jgi:hypothetical protein
MTGSSPYPPGFGAPPTPPHPGGAQPPQPPGLGSPPQWQPQSKAPRRGIWVPIGVAMAGLLSAIALVVALIGGGRGSSPGPVETQTAKPEDAQLFVDDADREFCEAMGPLMRESSDLRNALQRSGAPNTAERKAAIPQFVKDSYDWGSKAQEVLNQNATPPRFLTRNFQKYIDDATMFAEGLSPDRDSSIYESQLYQFGVMDLSGLIGRCSEVDATPWWN